MAPTNLRFEHGNFRPGARHSDFGFLQGSKKRREILMTGSLLNMRSSYLERKKPCPNLNKHRNGNTVAIWLLDTSSIQMLNMCNGIEMWTGPLACLRIVDKDQDSRSGI